MAISEIYTLPKTLNRHKQPPLGEFIDGFQEWLKFRGFKRSTMICHITYVTLFSEYLSGRGVFKISDVSQYQIDKFIQKFDVKPKPRYHPWIFAINRFIEYLNTINIIVGKGEALKKNTELLDEYCFWAKKNCQLAPSTIELWRSRLHHFFDNSSINLNVKYIKNLGYEELQNQYLKFIYKQGKGSQRTAQSALRSFFKFCYLAGHTNEQLSLAIPVIHTYRLNTTPRDISKQAIDKVLEVIDRKTSIGKRDYAIILLLYHYGVRGVQVRRLQLTDINWTESIIHFPACKGGKPVAMPLVQEVGEAIFIYLQEARPITEEINVFMTSRAPYHPLTHSSVLYNIASHYQKVAQVNLNHRGTHCYRHGFATRGLLQGYSLKSIADCLGHKDLQSTQIYTKVDACLLSDVALEIPGGVR